ncbi:MAG TPA: response regulator transcription factor [Blastocatellia bacterium]|nr:response regulator transcription factor [Blastocatellia bacterium]
MSHDEGNRASEPTSGASNPAIKVAIVEDHHKFRECLEFLLNNTPGYRCVGSFRSMEEALDKIKFDLPDVALIDIGLPGMSGVEGVRILKGRYPSLLMLINTVYDDDERIFKALCAGASGYLLKKTPPARLLECLHEAIAGGAPMSPEVARRVLTLFREISPPDDVDYRLTPHELRLLKLLVEGHSYKTAAAKLNVTAKTVSFHLQKIYEKLQVHSKSEAVAKALRNRLV